MNYPTPLQMVGVWNYEKHCFNQNVLKRFPDLFYANLKTLERWKQEGLRELNLTVK